MENNPIDKRPAQEILAAVAPSRWIEVGKELEADVRYKSHETLGNLQLILEKFGITEQAEKLAGELLSDPFGLEGDITFALATGQLGMFGEKVQELQSNLKNQ